MQMDRIKAEPLLNKAREAAGLPVEESKEPTVGGKPISEIDFSYSVLWGSTGDTLRDFFAKLFGKKKTAV